MFFEGTQIYWRNHNGWRWHLQIVDRSSPSALADPAPDDPGPLPGLLTDSRFRSTRSNYCVVYV